MPQQPYLDKMRAGRKPEQASDDFPKTDAIYNPEETPLAPSPEVIERIVEVEKEVTIYIPTPSEIIFDDYGTGWDGNIGLTETGLIAGPELSEHEWQVFFGRAHKMREFSDRFSKATGWILADYFAIGADRFQKSYEDMAKETGYEVSTVENYASTGRNFDELSRFNSPTFSHAQAVAGLHPDLQKHWLLQAKNNGWSVQKMENEIAGNTAPEKPKRSRKKVTFTDVKSDIEAFTRNATGKKKEKLIEYLEQKLNELKAEE